MRAAGADVDHAPLIAYYEEAGPDFEEWSAGFNMHFGYYRAGLNPLHREPMLNEMNRQVLERLRWTLAAAWAPRCGMRRRCFRASAASV